MTTTESYLQSPSWQQSLNWLSAIAQTAIVCYVIFSIPVRILLNAG